jgi:hypothetical protein
MVMVSLVDDSANESKVLLETKLHHLDASIVHRRGAYNSSMQLARLQVSSPEVSRSAYEHDPYPRTDPH